MNIAVIAIPEIFLIYIPDVAVNGGLCTVYYSVLVTHMSSLEEASHFAKSRGPTLGRGTVTIDDCIPGVIVFIKKCQYILHRDFVESGLSILGLRHPALVIKRVESKASHVLICPVSLYCYMECRHELTSFSSPRLGAVLFKSDIHTIVGNAIIIFQSIPEARSRLEASSSIRQANP